MALNDELQSLVLSRRRLVSWLAPRLYLGSGYAAHDRDLLRVLRVTHIVNVADDVSNLFDDIKYCSLNVRDMGQDEGISRVFGAAADFVSEALAEEGSGSVLVHCAAGCNRSPTVAVALLHLIKDIPVTAAYAHVKSFHPPTTIQKDNLQQLLHLCPPGTTVATLESSPRPSCPLTPIAYTTEDVRGCYTTC